MGLLGCASTVWEGRLSLLVWGEGEYGSGDRGWVEMLRRLLLQARPVGGGPPIVPGRAASQDHVRRFGVRALLHHIRRRIRQ